MKTRFTLRIEEELLKGLKILAVKENTSTSDIIISLVEDTIFRSNELTKTVFPNSIFKNLENEK